MAKKTINQEIPEEDTPYFVSIKAPIDLRRQMLESSKKSIHCLQNHQRILLIREKKKREMAELNDSIKELIFLNKKFNEKLPKYKHELLRDPKTITKETQEAVKPIEHRPPKVARPKPMREKTELEKLEDSLSSIEGKLKTLNTQ